MKFRQHAAGDFTCRVVPGTPHCGKDEGTGHFRYCVDVTYHNKAALDDNGFLLDNLDFQRWFDGLGPVSISCEALAIEACKHFEARLGDRLKYVDLLDVKIYPFGDVYVEAEDRP